MATEALRMRDVCARTGLARSTIHHYIREGVLPQPQRTGRNTALYDEEFVRRAQLVKTLQQRAHLPLSRIRETLASMPQGAARSIDLDRVAAVTQSIADTLRLVPGRALSKKELAAETELSLAEIEGLVRAKLIEPGDRGRFAALDVRIARAYAQLRSAGASVERGFSGSSQIVRAYRKYMSELARVEAKEMLRVMPALAGMDVDAFVREASGPLGEFIVALHQKALVHAIAETNKKG